MKARKNKPCPECHRNYSTSRFARHVRNCRMKSARKQNDLRCEYCSATFVRPYHAKRHRLACKARDGYIEKIHVSNTSTSGTDRPILLEMLQKKDIELSQTRQELLETQRELAKKETELAKRDMAIIELRAEKRTAPVHNHNNYYQTTYAIHMTPWGLDPSSPTYEGSLDADVREIRPLMDRLGPIPSLEEYVDLDEGEKARHSRPRQKVLFDKMRDGINLAKPRYIVLDCARQKGLFTSPDGSVKVDPRMSLLMEHQRKIAVATTPHREWYFKKGTPPLARFHDMVTTNGRNGAIRIAKGCDNIGVVSKKNV